MHNDRNLLFCNKDLSDVLRGHLESVQQQVDKIPQEQFLASDDDTILNHIFSVMEIQPLEIYEDRMELQQQESKMDVSRDWRRACYGEDGPVYHPSLRLVVNIPFTGTTELWHLKPNPWRTSFPYGVIKSSRTDSIGTLELIIELPTDSNPEEYKSQLESSLADVRFNLKNQLAQLEAHKQQLFDRIKRAIAQRRKHLEHHAVVRKVLDIPLKRRDGAPSVEPIVVKRRLVKPLPAAPNQPPEPGIRAEDYELILNIIRHEGRSFEATPATFAIHDEEELRDIILAHLNGHFQGQATGETFRRQGKTDIRIEDQNRAAFVAECKVWRGPKELKDAFDQLLGYLTWRDCKAAIILFNKHVAGFSEIQTKLPEIIQGHPNYRSKLSSEYAGEWRYRFNSVEDKGREITVHVFLFNLFVQAKTESRGK